MGPVQGALGRQGLLSVGGALGASTETPEQTELLGVSGVAHPAVPGLALLLSPLSLSSQSPWGWYELPGSQHVLLPRQGSLPWWAWIPGVLGSRSLQRCPGALACPQDTLASVLLHLLPELVHPLAAPRELSSGPSTASGHPGYLRQGPLRFCSLPLCTTSSFTSSSRDPSLPTPTLCAVAGSCPTLTLSSVPSAGVKAVWGGSVCLC